MRVVGWVEDVLPHGLRLAPNAPPSQTLECVVGDREPSYVAAFGEVAPDVLEMAQSRPFLSPKSPGFRSAGCQILVCFHVTDAWGEELRARSVQLADETTSQPRPGETHRAGMLPQDSVLVPVALHDLEGFHAPTPALLTEPSRIIHSEARDLWALEWSSARTLADARRQWHFARNPLSWRQAVSTLLCELSLAVQKHDASSLCEVLLRIAAGAREPRLSFCSVSSSGSRAGRQLSLLSWAGEQMCRAHEISLNDLARTCLSHLDMDEVVSAKTLLALKILDGTLTKKATLATCRNWQRPTSSSPTCRQTGYATGTCFVLWFVLVSVQHATAMSTAESFRRVANGSRARLSPSL